MNLQALKYFDEVNRCGSFRRAADKLNVAASAISRQIQNLEYDLGAQLFERSVRGVRLTEAGELLAIRVRGIFNSISQVKSDIDDLNDLQRGHVRVASVEGVANTIFAENCARFFVRFPLVQVAIEILDAQQVVEALLSETADIGITFGISDRPELNIVKRRPGHLAAVVPRDHPLSCEDHVTLKQIAKFPSILPSTGFGIRRLIEDESDRAGVQLKIAFESNSLELIRRMIETTGLLGILPHSKALDRSPSVNFKALPITEIDKSGYMTELCVKRTRILAPPVKMLLGSLEEDF
ncbi:LysR family transcriptional regulator [Celeribacter sp.]|uniref:LysR family transcriptional regulator n=1 Tax=Celeribacter sp. TaxID=1890673 RepID=UPI003A8D0508